MLRGNALAKIDEKGRLKLPSVFRSVIEPEYGNEFFVTSVRGESVRVFPMTVYAELEERLLRASSLQRTVSKLRTALNYFGQRAVMDPQGRILIHPLLRDKARLNGEVAVLGQQNYLEIWNRAAVEDRIDGGLGDQVRGGAARLQYVTNLQRESTSDPVLLVSAGDVMGGGLLHDAATTVSPETATDEPKPSPASVFEALR